MSITDPLLLGLSLPFLAAPFAYMAEKWFKAGAYLATLIFIISTAIFLTQLEGGVVEYKWLENIGVNFGLRADGLSIPIILLITGISALVSFYSKGYMEKKKSLPLYYALLLLFSGSMMGIILSTNFIQFYVFWEAVIIPAYFLIAKWGYGDSNRAAFQFFVYMHAGALLVLIAILWLSSFVQTFDIWEMSELTKFVPSGTLDIIMSLFLLGFGIKIALFPFHSWLPDTYCNSPTPISALLGGLMNKCGAYSIIRVLMLFSPSATALGWFWTLALTTLFYGAVVCLSQPDIKKLLAYSSMSQLGYIMFGALSGPAGILGGTFHIVNHGITKTLLFLCAGSVIHATGERDANKLGGLLHLMPFTALGFFISAISIAGIPPTNNFASEWMIFLAGFEHGAFFETTTAIIITVLTAAYMIIPINKIFFGKLKHKFTKTKEAPLTMLIPILILIIPEILFGIWPAPVVDIIRGVLGE